MEDFSFNTLMTELIINHQKNRLTCKKALKLKYKLEDVNEIIEKADLKLKKFGLCIIGLDENVVCNYRDARKVHIILTEPMQKVVLQAVSYFKPLVIILSVLFFEQNNISLVKLSEMLKDHIDIAQINFLKTKHYLDFKEEKEQLYVTFGWRYYLEFKEFNPVKILNNLKLKEKCTK